MQQMYVYYSLNTIVFRENFSFKLSISAQNSDGVGVKMHEGSYALLVGGQGVTVMLFVCGG